MKDRRKVQSDKDMEHFITNKVGNTQETGKTIKCMAKAHYTTLTTKSLMKVIGSKIVCGVTAFFIIKTLKLLNLLLLLPLLTKWTNFGVNIKVNLFRTTNAVMANSILLTTKSFKVHFKTI